MSANSSTPASSIASHSDIDAPKSLLRPSSHRPTRQSMQTFGGGGGGGEGAMNRKDIFSRRKERREERVLGLALARAHRAPSPFAPNFGAWEKPAGRDVCVEILCSTVEDLLKTGL